jgi:hypothetical protein
MIAINTPLDLILDASTKIGAYSRVFLDRPNNCVCKLFKSEGFAELFGYDGEPLGDAKRRAIFGAEVEAYQIAGSSEELRSLVAKYLGLCTIGSVRDADGVDKSGAFLLDQCYALEMRQGDEGKFDPQGKTLIQDWEDIREKFENAGIRVCDASVFRLRDGSVKLIDITTANPWEL